MIGWGIFFTVVGLGIVATVYDFWRIFKRNRAWERREAAIERELQQMVTRELERRR